jgi:hypothetical protein
MSQHCHCAVKGVPEFNVWIELLLTDSFRNEKTCNGQVCWISAFPTDHASDQVNIYSNAFSIAAAVLALYPQRTAKKNSGTAVNPQTDCSLQIVDISFISMFEESYTQCNTFVGGLCDFDFEELPVLNR